MEKPTFLKPVSLLLFCIICVLSFGALEANIGEYDEYWTNRAAAAEMVAKRAYDPHPHSATNRFNTAVHKMFKSNDTGRHLKEKHNGPCLATNPIDRCWRCRKNWASERKRLAKCVKGFAHGTTGGLKGDFYVVTDSSDTNVETPKFGTLRWGAIQVKPLWIVFARDMIITLKQELIIASDKTIDARGAKVHIAHGAQLTLQFVHNVIIHNLHIHDIVPGNGGMVRDSTEHCGYRTQSDGDGITVFGSSNIWIDHLSMSNCADGLIDVVQGSTAVTISNSHFTRHNDVMLFGASDAYSNDQIMQVTLAFNHFGRGLVQRMPRCRWGFFHVVNNDYTHWLMYAVGGSKNPTIISQGNRYVAPPNLSAKEVTKREYTSEGEWKNWIWHSQGDQMQNDAFFVQSGGQSSKHFSKTELIKAKPGTFVTRLTRFSGALNCYVGKKC